MNIVTTDEFIETITGRQIIGGEENPDGMHLHLDDGRVLIVVGVVYVGRIIKDTLQ